MLASLTRASARVLRTPHATTVARPLTRVTPARRAFSSEDRPAPSEKKEQNSAPQPTDGVPHPESVQRAPEIPFPGRKRGEKPVLWLASLPRAKTEADLKEELKATIAGVTRVDIRTFSAHSPPFLPYLCILIHLITREQR
ncbi:hypothetical protein BOTBODRAFT_474369 [Botryobasidium botryosum FD-172 SS1]|uniref:Uncharacterized protein n=1 Tax=Botryobasidium botryosum (strain FD-172 SS1) TaxID=930990 RepID=A0A067MH18_BOTB1|nr:hypothetical protein BOTBODRAFT_474369 [Botryobasidium botryosum FD-172 SS1]